MEFFNKRRVKIVLHAGDYVAPFVVRELKKLFSPLIGVFGNNDGEKEGLKKVMGQIGEIHPAPFSLQQEKRKILLLHEPQEWDSLEIDQYNLIVFGPTH